MSWFRLASVWAPLFSLLFAPTAHAFFDPPWITPENPLAGEVASVNIYGGICDIFLGRDGYPKITREGNTVRILIFGSHYEPGDELCVYPLWTGSRPIGTFPSGDYTLEVDLIYEHPVFGPAILNVGTVAFTVAAAPEPVSVPTIERTGVITLLLLLFAIATWRLRKHRALLAALTLIGLPLDIRTHEI